MLKSLTKIGLFTILGCTGITYLTITAIAPIIVQAGIPETNATIRREGEESFAVFLRRAEDLAKSVIESRFEQDKSLEELRVVIVGENHGAIAPVLTVKISRYRWKMEPNIERWANYSPDTALLLGFDQEKPKNPPNLDGLPALPPPEDGTKP